MILSIAGLDFRIMEITNIFFQDDEGMILLGLTEGESQNRIYTTASSTLEASTSRSTRPEPPRRVRKFAKQDLVVSILF